MSAAFSGRSRPDASDRVEIHETRIDVSRPRVAGLRSAGRRAERATRLVTLDDDAALLRLRADVAVRDGAAVGARDAIRSGRAAADAARIVAAISAMKSKAAVQLGLVSAADRIVRSLAPGSRNERWWCL